MKLVFHPDFYQVYASDPAAAAGRLEAVMEHLCHLVEVLEPKPAPKDAILAAHSAGHLDWVRAEGVHDVAALAAGGAMLAAETGLGQPCFGLIRPPGHHASRDSAWGFCYFNNLAIALLDLKTRGRIESALVLDLDLHFGDGTENILGGNKWVRIVNPGEGDRKKYLARVADELAGHPADIIAVSAGFDNHQDDWGRLMHTEDYFEMGRMVIRAARRNRGGCFGILEGGYNHQVLGANLLAFMRGMEDA